MSKVTIEVCERLMDYWVGSDGVKRPKYHAQIKDNPGFWGCGKNCDEAVGSLIRSHPEKFSIEMVQLDKLPR